MSRLEDEVLFQQQRCLFTRQECEAEVRLSGQTNDSLQHCVRDLEAETERLAGECLAKDAKINELLVLASPEPASRGTSGNTADAYFVKREGELRLRGIRLEKERAELDSIRDRLSAERKDLAGRKEQLRQDLQEILGALGADIAENTADWISAATDRIKTGVRTVLSRLKTLTSLQQPHPRHSRTESCIASDCGKPTRRRRGLSADSTRGSGSQDEDLILRLSTMLKNSGFSALEWRIRRLLVRSSADAKEYLAFFHESRHEQKAAELARREAELQGGHKELAAKREYLDALDKQLHFQQKALFVREKALAESEARRKVHPETPESVRKEDSVVKETPRDQLIRRNKELLDASTRLAQELRQFKRGAVQL